MALDPRITFTRASTATYYDSAGVLRTAASGAPRFDYDPVTHTPKGLLIEESRINAAQGSQDFTNINWTKAGMTVTADQVTAPDGTTTADLVTASATTATVTGPTIATGAVPYTMSIYAKKGTSNWFYLCPRITGTGAQTPKAYFNLNTGVVGTVEALITAASIQDVGNGWYRCTITSTGTAGSEFFMAGICDADNSAAVTVGRTIYLWGAQYEIAAFATSYMPTAPAASFTRAADVAVMTGTNFSAWYNQPAGTFVAEFDLLSAAGTRGIMGVSDASSNARNRFYGNAGTATIEIRATSLAVQATLTPGAIAANAVHKLGLSAAVNDIAACLNGGTVGTDTVALMSSMTQMGLGTEFVGGTNYLNGHLRKIKFYNVAKSDAALQALTT